MFTWKINFSLKEKEKLDFYPAPFFLLFPSFEVLEIYLIYHMLEKCYQCYKESISTARKSYHTYEL